MSGFIRLHKGYLKELGIDRLVIQVYINNIAWENDLKCE